MNRAFDLLLVLLAAPIWVPLLLVTVVAARIIQGSPVFFTQERVGLREKPFRILKIRTMRLGGGSDAARLTPFGTWLRRLSLDELPQLLQVLSGKMSLVGPRPLPVRYLSRYSAEQRRRHEVRPGITGLAQISGRNELSWEAKLALDIRYVDTRSFVLDLKILLLTIGRVLSRQGISAPGEETMGEFMGTPS